jgi:TRAP-type C4-dicarboxylate transport system substrate-binding protein
VKKSLIASLTLVCALTSPALAEPVTLRFATPAPDGTAWARLFRTMGREIETDSKGTVLTKFYFSGIAGDERQMLERLKKNQLDAVLSGGMMCMALSPSMRVLRLLGLFQSREEASYALGRLRDTIDKEFAAAGFHNVGEATLGSDMMFTRQPIASLADLKRTRLWYWDLDDAMREQLKAMGVPAVGTPVEEAARAFEDHRTDGFLAVPTAVLAFQWSAGTRYLSELHLGFLPGCLVVTNHAWDQLTHEQRLVLTEVTARTASRLEELGRSQDAQLLGGLFAKQGVKMTPVTPGFASEFFEAARTARVGLRDKLVPGALIDKVTGWIADFRAEYSRPRTN